MLYIYILRIHTQTHIQRSRYCFVINNHVNCNIDGDSILIQRERSCTEYCKIYFYRFSSLSIYLSLSVCLLSLSSIMRRLCLSLFLSLSLSFCVSRFHYLYIAYKFLLSLCRSPIGRVLLILYCHYVMPCRRSLAIRIYSFSEPKAATFLLSILTHAARIVLNAAHGRHNSYVTLKKKRCNSAGEEPLVYN